MRRLDDESLNLLICEIEGMLNIRPLKELSSCPDDLESLTPNHLLLSKALQVYLRVLMMRRTLYISASGYVFNTVQMSSGSVGRRSM